MARIFSRALTSLGVIFRPDSHIQAPGDLDLSAPLQTVMSVEAMAERAAARNAIASGVSGGTERRGIWSYALVLDFAGAGSDETSIEFNQVNLQPYGVDLTRYELQLERVYVQESTEASKPQCSAVYVGLSRSGQTPGNLAAAATWTPYLLLFRSTARTQIAGLSTIYVYMASSIDSAGTGQYRDPPYPIRLGTNDTMRLSGTAAGAGKLICVLDFTLHVL